MATTWVGKGWLSPGRRQSSQGIGFVLSTAVSAPEIEAPRRCGEVGRCAIPGFGECSCVRTSRFSVLHLRNLWRYRPHYEFFPLVLAAAAWLIWRRWPRGAAERSRLTRMLGTLLLLLGFGMLTGAVLLVSPWLGAIAAVLSLGGVLLALKGRAAWRELTGPWLLLWLVIPPPMALDSELMHVLQSVTARTTSGLLELLHVDHLLAGHVFRLPDRKLFVAEACSGVHSQLVLIAISVVLAILWRRSLVACRFLGGGVRLLRSDGEYGACAADRAGGRPLGRGSVGRLATRGPGVFPGGAGALVAAERRPVARGIARAGSQSLERRFGPGIGPRNGRGPWGE